MKRLEAAAVSLLMTFALATVSTAAGPVSSASAVPPATGTVFGATGTGQILDLDATVLPILAGGLDLANAGIATTNATTSSIAGTRSAATSSTIPTAVAGLPLAVSSSGQSAPPDNPSPTTGGLPDIDVDLPLLQLSLQALQVSNQARWSGDDRCPADGLLSDSKTTTGAASLSLVGTVVPAPAGTDVLTLAAADVRNTNLLVNTGTNAEFNKAVRSTASGTVTDLKLLGDTVIVTVTGSPTLIATAEGRPGGATVASNVSSLAVSVQIGSNAAVDVPVGGSLPIAGLGTLFVNEPTAVVESADGLTASGIWNFLTVDVDLDAASAAVQLLSMTASATAPSGGLDCPPPPPVIIAPAANATTGVAATISGTAEADAAVSVRVDDDPAVTTTADSAGNWSISSPQLIGGPHTVSATQTVGGATSDAVTRTFVVAVPAPTITAPPTGTVSNNPTPTVTGTGLADATATVLDGGTTLGTATVGADGTWSYPISTLTPGLHTLTATQRLGAGTDSVASNAVSYLVDTTAPAAPEITAPADGSRSNDTTPAVAGIGAEAGASVTVREGATQLCTVIVGTAGAWTCEAGPLDESAHTITASQVDVAGNGSPGSDPVTVTIDTTAPAAPAIAAPADGSSTADTTPTISGTGADAGTELQVREGTTVLCAVDPAPSGAWSCTSTVLLEGVHAITAVQTDAAGNASMPSATLSFTVDVTAPAAPAITAPTQGAEVHGPEVTIAGTGERGATVIVVVVGSTGPPVSAMVQSDGTWGVVLADFIPGDVTVAAGQVDAAGNRSALPDPTRGFTVTTRVTTAPVITSPASGSLSRIAKPTVSGTGEPGAVLSLFIDGSPAAAATTTVTGAGRWSVTPATALSDGNHTFRATQQVRAGGTSSPVSNAVTYFVDTTVVAPVITVPVNPSRTRNLRPGVNGTGEAGARVTVTESGGLAWCTATVAADGAWNCAASTTVKAQGFHLLRAIQTDRAGTLSRFSSSVLIVIDTIAPAAPRFTSPTDAGRAYAGDLQLRGIGAAGATLTLRDSTRAARGTVKVGQNGLWTIAVRGLQPGTLTLTATQADTAGNVSPVSRPLTLTLVPGGRSVSGVRAPVIAATTDRSSSPTTIPRFSGTGHPGAVVTVVDERGGQSARIRVSAAGTWASAFRNSAQGAHSYRAVQTIDQLLNGTRRTITISSQYVQLFVDTVEPAAPVLSAPVTDEPQAGALPVLGGTSEDGTVVWITLDGRAIGSASGEDTSGGRRWIIRSSVAVAPGNHRVVLTAVDSAGNRSPSTTYTIVTTSG